MTIFSNSHQLRLQLICPFKMYCGFPPVTTLFLLQCRHAFLPIELSRMIPKHHLLSESEWRNLGIQQSIGWEHYMTHNPGKRSCFGNERVGNTINCNPCFCRATHSTFSEAGPEALKFQTLCVKISNMHLSLWDFFHEIVIIVLEKLHHEVLYAHNTTNVQFQ